MGDVSLGEWLWTLAAVAGTLTLLVWARQRASAPVDPLRPRLFNHNYTMLFALIALILAGLHLLTLVSGAPVTGR